MSPIEQAIAELRAHIDQRFDAVDQEFAGVDQKFAGIDQKFAGVDQKFAAVDQRFDEMKAHFTILIDSVRDDVRIFAEAHIALERRVTRVETHGHQS